MNKTRFFFSTQYPHKYSEKNARLDFPNGAVIIIYTVDGTDYICATSDYDPLIDYNSQLIRQQYLHDYFLCVPKKNRPHFKANLSPTFSMATVPPIERTSILLTKALPCSMEYLYMEKYFHIINTYDACCMRYPDCNENSFRIAYIEYEDTNILYLGYTLDENPDVTEIEVMTGKKVSYITRGTFDNNRQEFLDQRNTKKASEKKEILRRSLIDSIQRWVRSTSYPAFQEAIRSRVKGQPEVDLVITTVYTYLCTLAKGNKPYRSNMILSAPSGSGKTETYRALRDYFAVQIPLLPVMQIDLSPYTESGYRGKNTSELEKIIAEKNSDGIAIVFLDELDKKIIPSYGSSGINYNAAVQAELLTMIEGNVITDPNGNILYDSSYTLFIGLGSFDVVREKKQKNADKNLIGFEAGSPLRGYEHYNDITIDDIIELGASYEFLGRFSLFVNYRKLPDKYILEIIDTMTAELSEALQIQISLTKKLKNFLLLEANGKFGCRRLRSLIETAVYPIYNRMLGAGKTESIITIDLPKSYHQKDLSIHQRRT